MYPKIGGRAQAEEGRAQAIRGRAQDSRVVEIDFLRGIAIICMVIFHWFYLLDIRTGSRYSHNVMIKGVGDIARTLFIFLLGVSVSLSKQKSRDDNKYLRKQLRRVLCLFGCGFLLILVTMCIYPDRFVRFGILQYMGVALLLLALFSYKIQPVGCMWGVPFLVGLVMYVVYIFSSKRESSNMFEQFVLGCRPNYRTMDYFPVFKWFWLSGLGLLVGNMLFRDGRGKYESLGLENSLVGRGVGELGKYSLEIYLIHFVVIYVLQMKISSNNK